MNMSLAEIAILISILSACISAISLGWNVYRDIVLKAKIIINFGVRTIVQEGNQNRPQYVVISATNHGPGSVNLSMIEVRNTSLWRWLFRKGEFGVVMHDYTNALSGQLPKKLEVGERIDLLFPYDKECFLSSGWSHVGVNDSFGRSHFAKRVQVKVANKRWQQDFGNT